MLDFNQNQSGDVVYVDPLISHTVLLGFKKRIEDSNKWCVLGGNVFILQQDEYAFYCYATRAVTGVRKDSLTLWARVLVAHTTMSGKRWREADVQTERNAFQSRLRQKNAEHFLKGSNSSVRRAKEKKRKIKMEQVRASKQIKN